MREAGPHPDMHGRLSLSSAAIRFERIRSCCLQYQPSGAEQAGRRQTGAGHLDCRGMIHVPTDPRPYGVRPARVGVGGACSARALPLAAGEMARRSRPRIGPGYFVAWPSARRRRLGAGSLNTMRWPQPALSHSIAGALVGAIVAVELYKRRAASAARPARLRRLVRPRDRGRPLGLPVRRPAGRAPTACRPRCPGGSTSATASRRHPVQIYESLAMARSWPSTSSAWRRARLGDAARLLRACVCGTARSDSPGSSSSPIQG